MKEFKNLKEIIELCNEELDNNEDVSATLDLEDLKELRELLKAYYNISEKTYKYFVSYLYADGMGNAEIGIKKKIDSLDDIKDIQDRISTNRRQPVTIINFTLLGEVEEWLI